MNATPAAWESWNKYIDNVDCKRYEYMLTLSAEVKVLLGAHLTQKGSAGWHVLINAFNPFAGEYVDFEGDFPTFAEAEIMAWKQAQEAIEARIKGRVK